MNLLNLSLSGCCHSVKFGSTDAYIRLPKLVKYIDCVLESIHSPVGPSLYGIKYLVVMSMLVVLICSRTAIIDKYLARVGRT